MRAVFLDRDGVLNRAFVRQGRPYPPQTPAEFEILDEARAACAKLRAGGYLLICVTNQPDVARGTARAQEVDWFNQKAKAELDLTDVRVCLHDDADACHCRKPKPGLLLEAARDYAIDLTQSFMVGDRWRDVAAGRAAGCRSIFIDRGYIERPPEQPDYIASSTLDAAFWIIAQTV